MANIINGRNLNLYYKLNGITYPACFATDCKLTLTGDTQETTTKNSLKGKTFDYQGKYSYTLSLRGITSLIDLPSISSFNYSVSEIAGLTDANFHLLENGVSVLDIYGNNTGTIQLTSGNTYKAVANSLLTEPAIDPKLTMIIKKNDVVVFAKTIPNPPGASMDYSGVVDVGSIYDISVAATDGTPDVTPVNIPDDGSSTASGVNVGTFQDFILQSNKMDFIFTDNDNIEWTGTVLITQVDNDSPVDNVSTFTNTMLGDGELTKVTGSIIPPPVGSAVTIADQFGNVISIVPAPGVYTVTKFNAIDLGDSSTISDPQIIITES